MSNTIASSGQRRNYLFAILALLIALVLGVTHHFNSANDAHNNTLQSHLDEKYDEVISLVKNNHPKEIEFKKLENSPFDIIIQENDSTIYWNNYITSLDARYTSSADYAILYKNIKNKHNITIGVDLRQDGKFSEYLDDKLHLDYNKGRSVTATMDDIEGTSYSIRAGAIKEYSLLNQASFLFYFLFIVLVIRSLSGHQYIDSRKLTLSIALGFIIFTLEHFVISKVYDDTYLANISNNTCTIFPNLQTSLVALLIVAFSFLMLKKSTLLKRMNSSVQHILFPFIITCSFITICYLAKGFLNSDPLSGLHQNVLQYTGEGIAFLLFFILGITTVFYISVILFQSLHQVVFQSKKYITFIIGIVATYPLAYFLDIQIPVWTVFTFVLSYILILELYIESNEKSIIYTIWWIIIFAGFLASITFFYRLDNGVKVQEQVIRELYQQSDSKSNQLIFEIDSILKSSDIFPRLSALPYPSGLDKDDYVAYLKSVIYKSNANISLTELDLEVVDKQGITLFNNHFSTAYTFAQSIARSDRKSDYIFYNPFENNYYLQYKIENTKYNDAPLSLSIKITTDVRNKNIDSKTNYVILKNDNVVSSNISGNVDFNLKQIMSIDSTILKDDISYTVYKPTENVKIVSFDKIGGLIKPISLFSFIVSISGLFLFFISLVNTKFRFLPSELNVQFYRSSSLRTKIQLAIIMLIVFSFVIIGVMTAFYFKSVLENYNNNKQKEDVTSIQNDIRNSIEGVENNLLASSTVQSKIDEMSHVHDKNLAFFDGQGKVLEASFIDPAISRVPFDIYRAYNTPGSATPTTRKTLQDDQYTIEFIPLYYKSQKNPYGYIGISYEPISNSGRSIRDFLSTILNVYVFLFLIAGALAIAIGNSITKPLAILSKKLKEFKLGKTNKVLDWDTKDEIGNLINEYNTLTEKLDESVNILARTERDVAWREMAKQVAHEIKNPLTPMKLSIQYLEKAVKSDPNAAAGLIERVSSTLIEQINNLNQIANEFSNFATMPKASNEKIVINEIVEAIHDLFRKREDMEIKMTEPIDDLYVFADRNHLVRILNNIVKNAIQAIPTDKKGIILMSLQKIGDMAVVAVRDNGTGIPDHMKDKVFTPNFTTKSSGTGLGLAISANMIESFNGRIYFETEVGTGTEFFVEIPLMRLQDNYPEQANRVSLD